MASKDEIRWRLTEEQAEVFGEEYATGRDSGHRKVSFHQCPHKAGTLAYDAWTRGWKSAQEPTSGLTRVAPDAADLAAIQRDLDEVNYHLVVEEDANPQRG